MWDRTRGLTDPPPSANAARIIQGSGVDSTLTPLGVEQARALGSTLKKHVKADAICSSDLSRAVQTARGIAEQYGGQAGDVEHGVQVGGLREMNYGALEGRSLVLDKDAMAEVVALQERWNTSRTCAREKCAGGGESYFDVATRGLAALDTLVDRYGPSATVVAVSHSRTIKACLSFLSTGLSCGYFVPCSGSWYSGRNSRCSATIDRGGGTSRHGPDEATELRDQCPRRRELTLRSRALVQGQDPRDECGGRRSSRCRRSTRNEQRTVQALRRQKQKRKKTTWGALFKSLQCNSPASPHDALSRRQRSSSCCCFVSFRSSSSSKFQLPSTLISPLARPTSRLVLLMLRLSISLAPRSAAAESDPPAAM